MHSLSDLAAVSRKTTGHVPEQLVGASTTVIGSKLYLFGGRPETERKVVSDLYVCDLRTFVWEKIIFSRKDEIPSPRCFHSADAWNGLLVIFGGFGKNPLSSNPDELCVLNDVQMFDPASRRWLSSLILNNRVANTVPPPKSRHSHLSSITSDCLFIIGGQDLRDWLDDIYVYDLCGKAWIRCRPYPRHFGSYLSIAAVANLCVHQTTGSRQLPQNFANGSQGQSRSSPHMIQSPHKIQSPGGLNSISRSTATSGTTHVPPPTMLADGSFRDTHIGSTTSWNSSVTSHLPYSAPSTDGDPCAIHLYSNYNFTDVKRKLEVLTPRPKCDFAVRDESSALSDVRAPPCLRWPTGSIVGNHLIIAGAYLGPSRQCFAVWALNLLTMKWFRIDTGPHLRSGSWFQSCLWRDANKFLMFGSRQDDLPKEQDHVKRISSWDHVICVDLEAFGVYQPPPLELDVVMQEFSLTALEEAVGSDFEFLCDDGRRIKCSRKLLEERWPWFKSQILILLEKAKLALGVAPSSSPPSPLGNGTLDLKTKQADPRITTRVFQLSEPYPVTLALLQYFYTLSLPTPLQQAPAVLSQLLVLSTTYQIPRLQSLVKHAMHLALSDSTCAGVHEVANACGCRSLQIRAYRTILAQEKKHTQSTARSQVSKTEREAQVPRESSPDDSSDSDSPTLANVQLLQRPQHSTGPDRDEAPPSTTVVDVPTSMPRNTSKKPSALLGKVLRVTAPNGASPAPSRKKIPSLKWRTGGGRHPVVVDRAARARKIQAIEAAMSGYSSEESLKAVDDTLVIGHNQSSDTKSTMSSHPQPFPDPLRNATDWPSSAHEQSNGLRMLANASTPCLPSRSLTTIPENPYPAPSRSVDSRIRPSLSATKNRSFHVVSPSTDQDIRSIAAIISPLIVSKLELEHADERALGSDDDSIVEPSLYHEADDYPVKKLKKVIIE